MDYKIGDIVVTAFGEKNVIVDKMWSTRDNKYYCTLQSSEGMVEESGYTEERFKLYEDEDKDANFSVEIQRADSVIIGIIYKEIDGKKIEVSRGHGHIIHDGEKGIIQAISYAFKKAYERISDGQF